MGLDKTINVTQLQHYITKPCEGCLHPKVKLYNALLDVTFIGLLWNVRASFLLEITTFFGKPKDCMAG